MRLIILLLTFYASTAFSASINLGVLTHHNDVMACGYECNEQNNLIAIEYKDLVIATFNNSYYRETYLIAKNFKLNNNIGILAGISHGYDQDCFNPYKTSCSANGKFNREINPFASLLIEKQIGSFKIKWLEAFTYRTLLIGYEL